MKSRALVLDIGGSHVTSALVDLNKRIIVSSSLYRLSLNPDASADELLSLWTQAAQQAKGELQVNHIGVGMPGPFEYDTGVSKLEHKFAALYSMNVGQALQQRLTTDAPIYFGNDASLFGLGEWWAGAARGYERVIGITLGTGLGGGFVADGRILYSGKGVPPDGGIWNLPYLEGIAEDYVSGPSLIKIYTSKTGKILTPLEIAQAVVYDKNARESYQELGFHLGQILKPWVKSFNATCVVVGGNIARSWDLFADAFAHSLNDSTITLVPSQLYEEANLLGAAALGTHE